MAPSKKTMLFVCLLVAALAVAQAQLINIPVTGIIRVQGLLYCSVNGVATVGANGVILTPAFSSATVQLRCGTGTGTLIASVQTNANGVFSILLNPSFYSVTQILSGCRVVVATPLATCNAALPSTGTLTGPLISLGNTILGGLLPLNNIGIGSLSVSA